MKAGIRIGTMGVLAVGLLVGQAAFAESQETRAGKGKGAGRQAGSVGDSENTGAGVKERQQGREQERDEMHEKMRERMEKHQQARRQLMEAVRAEEDAQKALALVREHCVSQHAERSAFHEKMMADRLAKVGERLKDSNMDEAKREEILKEMVKNMEERKAGAEAQYAELLANLDALKGKEDLTKKDILDALRDVTADLKVSVFFRFESA